MYYLQSIFQRTIVQTIVIKQFDLMPRTILTLECMTSAICCNQIWRMNVRIIITTTTHATINTVRACTCTYMYIHTYIFIHAWIHY